LSSDSYCANSDSYALSKDSRILATRGDGRFIMLPACFIQFLDPLKEYSASDVICILAKYLHFGFCKHFLIVQHVEDSVGFAELFDLLPRFSNCDIVLVKSFAGSFNVAIGSFKDTVETNDGVVKSPVDYLSSVIQTKWANIKVHSSNNSWSFGYIICSDIMSEKSLFELLEFCKAKVMLDWIVYYDGPRIAGIIRGGSVNGGKTLPQCSEHLPVVLHGKESRAFSLSYIDYSHVYIL